MEDLDIFNIDGSDASPQAVAEAVFQRASERLENENPDFLIFHLYALYSVRVYTGMGKEPNANALDEESYGLAFAVDFDATGHELYDKDSSDANKFESSWVEEFFNHLGPMLAKLSKTIFFASDGPDEMNVWKIQNA